MKYRILGKSGLKVSVVGVGTWQFGGGWGKEFDQEEASAMLARARELGINLIDTAACYGPDHRSEELIGGFLEGENREDWIVASKFGHAPGWEPAEVEQTLEDSLAALRTDYLDLFQFHSGNDEEFDTPGLWEMLNEKVEDGKIRHLGISLSLGSESGYQTEQAPKVGASAIQVNYSRLRRVAEEEILPACREHNLGVLARTPLASGFLSGKYDEEADFPESDVRSKRDREDIRRTVAEVQSIREEEVPEDVPMAQWALAWCLTNPAVTCVIPGCKTVGQVEANAAAADLEMVPDDHPQACD